MPAVFLTQLRALAEQCQKYESDVRVSAPVVLALLDVADAANETEHVRESRWRGACDCGMCQGLMRLEADETMALSTQEIPRP